MSGCPHPFGHPDEAKRMSDAVMLHWISLGWESVGKWVAIRLSDGGSDNTLYEKKREAVRHQADEFLCAYVKLHPGGMSPCEAHIMLTFTRKAYDAGFRLPDPDRKDGGQDLIPRIGADTLLAQMRALNTKRGR
jgi:hypothetical protein